MLHTRRSTLVLALWLAGCSLPNESVDREAPRDTSRWLTVDAERLAHARAVLPAELAAALVVVERNDEVAVVRAPAATIDALTEALHADGHRCGGFMMHASHELAVAAARTATRPARLYAYAGPPTIDLPEVVAAVQAQVEEPPIADTIRAMSAFQNRYYQSDSGVDAAEWLADHWRGLAGGRTDVTVELIGHSFLQPSVEMRITGTTLPDEYVVIGGHLDSIAPGGSSSTAPGADDNASGVAAVTEVARAIFAADFRPERTVLFYGYAGEELGLLGSQDIADQAAAAGLDIVGALQLDMVNHKGSSIDMSIITDYTDPALTAFLEDLVDTYVGATWVHGTCGYACSDHASWYRAGFPVAHPFESRPSDINGALHTPGDTIAVSGDNAEHAMLFARLAAAFVVELAKGTAGAPPECDDATPCGTGFDCVDGSCVPIEPDDPDDPGTGDPDVPGDPDDPDDGPPADDDGYAGPVVGGCAAGGTPADPGALALLLAMLGLARRRR